MLGRRHPDGDGQAELHPHPPTDLRCHLLGRTEQVHRAGHVQERLVDVHPLDQRREGAQHLDHVVSEALILAVVAPNEGDVRAQLAGAPAGHAGVDAQGLRLIGGGEDDTAAHGHRLAPQAGIEQLLHRRVERVEVGVEDRRSPSERHRPPR